MVTVQKCWATIWRSILVSIGYCSTLIAVGVIGSVLGIRTASGPGSESILVWLLFSGMLMGLFLGPLAAQMHISRGRHFLLWASVIFFNLSSVAIEGALFAPKLVPVPVRVLFIQQLLASAVAAILITRLFSLSGQSALFMESLRRRPWTSWAWRFVVGSLSYLLFYYVFGTISYNLVTKPYYDSHTSGLTVPSGGLVLATESIRAPLMVLSAVLFVFSLEATKRRLALITGLMLFWIGGVVPLLLQVNALPLPFLLASGVEIFFQNFLTGVVTALLFWTPPLQAVGSGESQ
jgi:hypothetical protein